MSKEKNVSRLRFPGFTDDWEQHKFGDLADYKKGPFGSAITKDMFVPKGDGAVKVYEQQNAINKDWSLERYFLPKEYALTKLKSFEVHGGDIIVSCAGTIGEIYEIPEVAESGVINQALMRVRVNESIIDKKMFIISFSNMIDDFTRAHSNGSAIKNIPPFADLKPMEVLIPSINEQRKISGFFEGIDNLITLHQRKCEAMKRYKSGMLQKVFPREGQRVPEVRFPGFTGAWEKCKLGEVCERVTRKNKNGESDLPLTIASQYGLIDQRDFFNRVVAAKDMSNYYLLKKGEFAYNKSYSNGFDYGSIKRLNAYEQGCLSTLYICFGITSDDVESDYLECYFDTLKWYEDVSQICAEGARNHGLLNVDTKAFFDEVTIEMPSSKEEQSKISAYLNNLDNLITLHQRKCEELKEYKKGLLQQMFV